MDKSVESGKKKKYYGQKFLYSFQPGPKVMLLSITGLLSLSMLIWYTFFGIINLHDKQQACYNDWTELRYKDTINVVSITTFGPFVSCYNGTNTIYGKSKIGSSLNLSSNCWVPVNDIDYHILHEGSILISNTAKINYVDEHEWEKIRDGFPIESKYTWWRRYGLAIGVFIFSLIVIMSCKDEDSLFDIYYRYKADRLKISIDEAQKQNKVDKLIRNILVTFILLTPLVFIVFNLIYVNRETWISL